MLNYKKGKSLLGYIIPKCEICYAFTPETLHSCSPEYGKEHRVSYPDSYPGTYPERMRRLGTVGKN